MGSARDLILDAWSSLSHKKPMREDPASKTSRQAWTPDTWMGEEHRRRLTAYVILSAYDSNVSRVFLDSDDESERDSRREYGDAGLIIDQTLAHLLGEDQDVVVPGAENYDPDLEGTLTARLDGEGKPVPLTDAETHQLTDNAAAGRLADLQDHLRDWAEDELLKLRMVDCERNAVRSGDGVYLLGWDEAKRRPTVVVMDPGFYFPVLPDTLDAYAYPTRIHFAWEIPGEDFHDGKVRIRRITYDVRPMTPEYDDDGTEYLPEGAKWHTVQAGTDDEDSIVELVRDYPWNAEPTSKACYLTDATWILDDLNDPHNVDSFTFEHATIRVDDDGNELRDHDLGIDFLPVVHIPNQPSGGDHFGQSSLARVLQLLDDLQAADTDAYDAAALTGSPIIGISGTATMGDNVLTGQRGQHIEVAPGLVLRLGENGRLDALDTANNLKATRDFVLSLRDRLSVNSRLPGAVLGTVKPSEVPSGFAMQLSFGPLTSMIRVMRLVRSVKYPLLLKFVIRLHQANGELLDFGADTPRAEVQFGAYLPSDQADVLERVSTAYAADLISLETAVTMLLEAGFPIDDVAEEIVRIQARDFEGANRLADATADTAAVRDYLGLDPAPAPSQGGPLVDPAIGEPIAGGTGAGVPSPSDSGAGA